MALTRVDSGGIRILLPIFSRTRGAVLGAVAAAVATALVIVLHALTQAVTPSPEQRAQAVLGDFEYSIAGVATVPLGSGPSLAEVRAALTDAGARSTGTQLYIVDVSGGDRQSTEQIRYVETDLVGVSRTGAAHLLSGTAPIEPGTACISPALAADVGEQTALTFLSGALHLAVHCTAVDDQTRDERTIYAAPGTWAEAGRSLGADAVRRLGVRADLNVHWSGGDPARVAQAARSVADVGAGRTSQAGPTVPGDTSDIESSSLFLAEPRTFNAVRNVWVFLVPLVLFPAVAGGVAAWGGAALLTRSVGTLRDLGLRRRRIRVLTWALPAAMTAVGTVGGGAAGLLLGWGIRALLAHTLTRPAGPWTGLPVVLAVIVATSIAGTVLGTGAVSLRLSARMREDFAWARRRSIPWPSASLLAGLAVLCLVGAVLTTASAATSSRRTTAVVLVALAVVLVVPALVRGGARRGLRAGAGSLITTRMLTARGGVWIVMVLFGLQAVTATGGVTMAVSGVESGNERLVQTVPSDQARLQAIQIEDVSLQEQLVEDISSALGAVPGMALQDVAAGTRVADGPVTVVDSAEQAAVALGMEELPAGAAHSLAHGAVLRAVPTPDDRLVITDPENENPQSVDAVLAELPVAQVTGASGLLSSGGGVVLKEVAVRNALPLTPVLEVVFPDLGPEQQTTAQNLAENLRFNPDWLSLPKAPDRFVVPASMIQGAWIVAVIAIGVALVLGLQTGAAARRVLAAARALGLRRAWTRRVLAGQLAWVVLAPTAAGIVGSLVGVWAVTRIGGAPVDLYVPWAVITPMLAGTMVAYSVAVLLALRSLHARDRLG